MVSNNVNEYDAECNMANNAIGSRATVTGSDPVYKNNKLKCKYVKQQLICQPKGGETSP